MASLTRPSVASYSVAQHYDAETHDHEDHTFSGVMFTLLCKDELPLEFIEVSSLWVRGELGPMTVWWTDEGWFGKHERRACWTRVFQGTVAPSPARLSPLELAPGPLRVAPGASVGLYVHSACPGDRAVVYDNQRAAVTHEDRIVQLLPGLAHLSNRPFSSSHPWGAWRARRQFVGRVSYRATYLLWNPECHARFPAPFRRACALLFLCQRRDESPLSRMPDDVLFYILNMLPHDWVAEPPPPARGAAALLNRLLAAPAEPADADAGDGAGADGAKRASDASGRPVVVKVRAFGRRVKRAAGRAMRRLFAM